MANYTIELYKLLDNVVSPVFDFEYDFYCDDELVKKKFEQKFTDHYFYHEIGCETPTRWKQMLKARLNLIMPYYSQLYQTELSAKNIDFMLNKDLREEFIRESSAISDNKGTQSTNSNQTTSTTVNNNSRGTTDGKVSNINDGVSNAELSSGYLTGVSQDISSTNEDTTSNATNSDMINQVGENHTSNTQQEKTVFVSQGNIGVTSSAELLEKWRGVLINIDQLIINDCKDLFIQIY